MRHRKIAWNQFTISHIKFHVNFFQWGWTKQSEYVINGIKIVLQIHFNHQYHSKLQTYRIIVCLQVLIFRGLQHQCSFMANRTAIFQFNSTHAVHKLLLLLTTMAITTNLQPRITSFPKCKLVTFRKATALQHLETTANL